MLLVSRWSQQHAKQYSSPWSAQNMKPLTSILFPIDVDPEVVSSSRPFGTIMRIYVVGLVVVVADEASVKRRTPANAGWLAGVDGD